MNKFFRVSKFPRKRRLLKLQEDAFEREFLIR